MTIIFVNIKIVCIFDIQIKCMTQSQDNTYVVYDSMGRRTNIIIMASNIKDAYTKAKTPEIKAKINSAYYKLKRANNGGIMGQR
jgi:hypothetical protein